MAPTMSTILASIFARNEEQQYHAFPWVIARDDGSMEGCPSRVRILVTWAVVNIIMGIFAVIGGHKKVVNKGTCGFLGRDTKLKAYNFMWIPKVGLNLAKSAAVAYVMKNAKGYGDRFDVGQVMLFYTTIPRITWIFAGLLTTPFTNQRALGPHWTDGWVDFAYTQVYTEIALQAICIYTLISANIFHYQQTASGVVEVPDAIPLYKAPLGMMEVNVGAFGWIVMFGLSALMFTAVATFNRSRLRRARDWSFLALVFTLVCNWLFWDGYLREFPTEYCPPKLTLQAVIMVIFSTISIPLGSLF